MQLSVASMCNCSRRAFQSDRMIFNQNRRARERKTPKTNLQSTNIHMDWTQKKKITHRNSFSFVVQHNYICSGFIVYHNFHSFFSLLQSRSLLSVSIRPMKNRRIENEDAVFFSHIWRLCVALVTSKFKRILTRCSLKSNHLTMSWESFRIITHAWPFNVAWFRTIYICLFISIHIFCSHRSAHFNQSQILYHI